MTSIRINYGLGSYTPARYDEVRRQVRESLERFELPVSDMPPPAVSPDGMVTFPLPLPAKFAFTALIELLTGTDSSIGARDDDAFQATLRSGVHLNLWPNGDLACEIRMTGIIAEDDTTTGARFREAASLITQLNENLPKILKQAEEVILTKRVDAFEAQFNEAERADLDQVIAALESAGYEVRLRDSQRERFSVRIFRAPDISYNFTDLGAFLSYGRSITSPAARPSPTPNDVPLPQLRATAVERRSGSRVLSFLLVLGWTFFLGLLAYLWWR